MLLYLQSDAQRWARVGWREKKGLAYPVVEVILKRAGYRAQGLSWAGWLHRISWHYLENYQLASLTEQLDVVGPIIPKLKPKFEFIIDVRGKTINKLPSFIITVIYVLSPVYQKKRILWSSTKLYLDRRESWWINGGGKLCFTQTHKCPGILRGEFNPMLILCHFMALGTYSTVCSYTYMYLHVHINTYMYVFHDIQRTETT